MVRYTALRAVGCRRSGPPEGMWYTIPSRTHNLTMTNPITFTYTDRWGDPDTVTFESEAEAREALADIIDGDDTPPSVRWQAIAMREELEQ